jgi:DNA-binding NarL/FixJ family response regulator
MTMAARRLGDQRECGNSSHLARVATFRHGDTHFAVVSVPNDDEQLLAALSTAEGDVAMLAAEGITNAAIAQRRGTSRRTVANQMASIFRKLGIGSRLELAARIAPKPSRRTPP